MQGKSLGRKRNHPTKKAQKLSRLPLNQNENLHLSHFLERVTEDRLPLLRRRPPRVAHVYLMVAPAEAVAILLDEGLD